MGRPSGFNREDAVETAMQEIWRAGYEASSVKAISERLGITRSSYYNAFGSREELFKEVLATYLAQSPDRALHAEIPKTSIKELLTSTFREICRVRAADAEGRGCLAINCLCELMSGSHDRFGGMIADAIFANAARMEELLSVAVARGELPEQTDVRAKALALQALLVGLNALSRAVRSEEDLWLSARTTLKGLGLCDDGQSQERC